ncbi:sigma 54-interacting transcriptional regulator [Fulvivirga lutea]|uniref:Sigma 54-interacting transcriptional regulator n=1 Tax=Fulvivirga lutea TaxID=2810512 RepID=A0A974WLT0_9BACT|nr:sigma 54-interacting transcriptional regulator [Fulvivirga lutea]QSE97758.1 sigma 54-interacting transcriptional regulator [Fulvivirga lutea]
MNKTSLVSAHTLEESIKNAPFAMCWMNAEGELIAVNNQFCELSGYSNEVLLAKKVTDIHPDFSLKSFKSYFSKLSSNSEEAFDTPLLLCSGNEKVVQIIPRIFKSDESELLCHFLIDVEKQRSVEQELMANQERWKVGMEILNEGVWDWNIKDKKIFFSNQFAENLGYTRKELMNFLTDWNDFLHPDDSAKYSIRLADHLKGLTKKYESEHRLKNKAGQYRWFKDRGMVIARDENGRATRMIGSSLDITERLELESKEKATTKRALEDSQNKFQNILNYSNDAIIILDAVTQSIAEVNPRSEDILGFRGKELIGKKISEYTPSQHDKINKFLDSVLSSKKGLSAQFVLQCKNGETISAEVSASHYAVEQNQGIILVIQPISQQKHIEGIITRLVEEALSKSKMDFIPNFIRTMAEYLNVSIVGISQVVDNVQDELEIVSLWNKDHFEENYTYKVNGSPAEKVLKEGTTYYRQGIAQAFPKDAFLTANKSQGYLGVPISDSSKKTIGHLFIIDSKELEREPWVESLLLIGANRMGLEIERKRVEDELKERLELEGLVSDISAEFINANEKTIRESIDWALRKVGEYVNADRSYIFKLSEDGSYGTTTAEWVKRDVMPLKSEFQKVLRKDYPWPFELLDAKRMLLISDIEEQTDDIGAFQKIFDQYGIKSMLNMPMVVGNRVYGYMGFDAEQKNNWSINDIILLKLVAEVIVNSIERVTIEKSLRQMNDNLEKEVKDRTKKLEKALEEVKDLRDKLEAENIYLKEEIGSTNYIENIISQDKDFKRVLVDMEHVAKTSSTVLILGETGTGKEVISKAIHSLSERKDKPLIKINCAALPATLIESELFGHEKGAFTGAVAAKQGRFELADGGTLFLDEVGEMPIELQPKLLRALQEGEFERLGGTKTIKVDVRLIAATNRDLEKAVEEGSFRSDLFYRLNVFPLYIPALRERKSDIRLLVNHFVQRYNQKLGKEVNKIPQSVISQLEKYNWPGNVRELENIIERAVIISPSNQLKLGDWFLSGTKSTQNDDKFETLEKFERNYILKVLHHTNWKISGPGGAAEVLGLKPTTLESRIKKLNISRQ